MYDDNITDKTRTDRTYNASEYINNESGTTSIVVGGSELINTTEADQLKSKGPGGGINIANEDMRKEPALTKQGSVRIQHLQMLGWMQTLHT